MSESVIIRHLLNRVDTNAAWSASNPVLKDGEFAIVSDLGKLKVGDGVKTFSELDDFAILPAFIVEIITNLNNVITGLLNYKGEWNSLSGLVETPASVKHLGKFYIVLVNMDNIENHEPSEESLYYELYEPDASTIKYKESTVAEVLDKAALITGENGALIVPADTAAQRPAGTPPAGYGFVRINTTSNQIEFNLGAGWI